MISFAPMLFDARIQKEANSLLKAGYKVDIFYIEDEEMLESIPNLKDALDNYSISMSGINSTPVILWTKKKFTSVKTLKRTFQLIEIIFKFSLILIKTKFDIIHIHDLKPGFVGLLAKLFKGAKIVYDAHELEYTTGGKGFEWLFKMYEWFLLKFSDRNITVNSTICSYMVNEYNCNVTVVGNRPLYVESKDLQPIDFNKKLGLSGDNIFLIYVGYLSVGTRGIEQIIKALALMKHDCFFLILGVGRILAFKEYINRFIVENELSSYKDKVHFLEPVPPNEVINYISGSDLSMMLYQKNSENSEINSPNKLYQSIIARTPILASNNKSFPKIILNNKFGKIGEVVDESSSFEIAKKN
ncbi:MAG: glycosyltransferase [Cytophagaceae bacterium]|nr:glycosyltransferase [Cytophagaceae bacterium]